MIDPRIVKQSEIIVDYSLKVKRGEKIVVIGGFDARPLMIEIYRLLIQRGAYDVKLKFDSYEFSEIYFNEAKADQIKYFPQIDMDEIKYMDCYIRIGSSENTKGLTAVDTKLLAEKMKVLRPITDYRVEKTRWVVTKFPTESQAQDAEMSLSDYEEFVFNAINKVDWRKIFKQQEKLRKLMDDTDKVHIVGPSTDLTLSIKGRTAENAAGEYNMPDGEVFTSTVETSANGFITYTYPAIYMGKEFTNVRLEFKDGKVFKATSDKAEDALNNMLDADNGARYIGELGIGNNFEIKKFTKDILFDEKIGGSIHIALGKGYEKTKSKNVSAIHWDMIKDLRKGGELWFDKKLVQKNGKWLVNF
jgi:aminopeptidase